MGSSRQRESLRREKVRRKKEIQQYRLRLERGMLFKNSVLAV